MTDLQRLFFQAVMSLPGIFLCGHLLRRVRERGGRVATAGFGIADLLLASFLCVFFALSTVASGLVKGDGTAEIHVPTSNAIALNIIVFLGFVAVFWVSLRWRKQEPSVMFGLRRWPLWRALLAGGLIVAALFPLLAAAAEIVSRALQGGATEQEVVTMLRQTKKSGDQSMFGMLVFLAVVFQPAVEELLFRGYFYGVFKGWAGALASAVFTATLFAAIHGNVAALVPLLLFALALTLAYEWSGSLLVPIAMHMTFNGVQLAVLTWAPQLLEKQ